MSDEARGRALRQWAEDIDITARTRALSAWVRVDWIKATRPPICYRNHHPRSPDIDMDDIRSSLSKLKKGVKYRFRGKKHAPDKVGVGTAGERVDSSGSLLQPEPHLTASGDSGGGSRISADVRQVRSRDPSPQSKPIPAGGGNEDTQKGSGDVDEKEVSQGHSGSNPDTKVTVGSGPDQGVHSSPSPPSLSNEAEPGGACSSFTSPTDLTISYPSDNVDTAEPGSVVDKKSDWKSTTFATAKLLLRGVRDSADAFGPLKSVVGGLCFILENCEVRLSPQTLNRNSYRCPAYEGK